jgi:glycerophosphoryl diester phosphodiesterase
MIGRSGPSQQFSILRRVTPLPPVLARAPGAPLRIAHRGASTLAPENTLPAIEAATRLGADLVEVDVHRLIDGALVLRHDPPPRLVLAELQAREPGVPTLAAALDLLAATTAGVHLDLKGEGFAPGVARAVRAAGMLERSLASSFLPRALRALGEEEPSLPLGWSYPGDRLGIAAALGPALPALLRVLRLALPAKVVRGTGSAGARIAVLHRDVVSAAVVTRCREAGLGVLAWTVNDAAEMRRLAALDVDGVISDDIPLLIGTLTAAR